MLVTQSLQNSRANGTTGGNVVSNWTFNYNSRGGTVVYQTQFTSYATSTGNKQYTIKIGNTSYLFNFFFNQTTTHTAIYTVIMPEYYQLVQTNFNYN